MSSFQKGDWTNCRYDICEIVKDGDVFCTVATDDVDLIIKVLNENEQLKHKLQQQELEYATTCNRLTEENEELKQSNQELNDELQETMGYLALKSGIEKENEQLKSFKEQNINEYLKLKEVCNECKKENEQLKEKLNEIKNGLISDLEKGIGEQPIVVSMYLQSIIDLIGDVE